MIRTWWQSLAKQTATRRSLGSHVQAQGKRFPPLRLEWLESRLAPATHTWTGATSALWSVATNWNGGSPAGDPSAVLVFPGGAANIANMNDLTNLTIQSITFSGINYNLSGNVITLNGGGITLNSLVTTSITTINLPTTLGATQTWTLTNASATLQVGGVISGGATAGLTEAGAGTLILTATNTYTGTTTVAAGSLLVNGAQPGSNVTVDAGATLGGAGTVGTVTTAGAIIPGGSPGAGILRSSNVTFNAGSSLAVLLNGTTPGTGYSQLNVTGSVNLSGNPTLTVTLGSFAPAVGNTFMPITSTGTVSGVFNGLADNSTLTVSQRNFRVNYQTNDVLLTLASINSQTVVTSSANPSVFGQPVTFTATVAAAVRPTTVTPTGTVTFRDGANTLGTGPVTASGVATFPIMTPLSVGTHSITAVYSGDSNFATSTSTALIQTVNKAATTTTVTSSTNPSAFGQAVTFTATVIPATPATATGTVTFRDGANTLGTATLAANGTATFTFLIPDVPLAPGTHTITAVYNGDNNFMSSTSAILAQIVNRGNTTTAITSSLNPSPSGQPVTFTASVSFASGGFIFPTGTVTFKDGTTTLGASSFTLASQATFVTSSLSPGVHSITATYSGDSNYAGSTSPALIQTISQPSGTPNQSYVTQLYRDVLRRTPDGGGLTFWTGLLDQNKASRSQVALSFTNSPEFRMQEVGDLYHTFLKRDVDPTGLSGWTQFLVRGHTLEQLEAQIVASPEYLQRRAGENTNNFLATLFMDAFNRPLDQAGRDKYGDEDVDSGGDRRELAEQIFASTEFRQDLVQSYYQRFLNRSAEPGGLNAATNALGNGVADETLIAVIVSSPEYVANRVQQ